MTDKQSLPRALSQNIRKVIVGKDDAVELLLIALLCRGHVLIEDVPGVGKTTLAMSLAKSLGCSFQRIQFTPDIMPSDITGYVAPDPRTREFHFHPGLVMSQVVLADEINRTSPKTQSSLLEVMDEGQVTVDGQTHTMPQPFIVLATQNPLDFAGTFPLPEAQLDRFFLCIRLGYPSVNEEIEILKRVQVDNPLAQIQPIASGAQIMEMQRQVRAIYCAEEVRAYIANIVASTRTMPEVQLGASPRGAIALMRAAQASAFLAGRDFTLPDDIQRMAAPVLAHRITLRSEARLKATTPERVLASIITKVRVPVARQ